MKKRKKKILEIKNSDYGSIGFIKENKGLFNVMMDLGVSFLNNFPTEKDDHFFSHTYGYRVEKIQGNLKFYIELYRYLDISNQDVDSLDQLYWEISSHSSNKTKKDFKLSFDLLLHQLIHTDSQIFEKLKELNRVECIRLDESMKSLRIECNLSSTVMAVSAVEHRLHKLISNANSKLYKKDFEKVTLGGIISLFKKDYYTEKKYQIFKKILPDKHKPLIEMLNIYRIFSAHPKDISITNQTAKAILELSFLLLTDKHMKI
jgi:hypothetical protein